MVTWNYLFNEVDFEDYCNTLQNNCVAKLLYEGVNYPGFIDVEKRVAYFYNPSFPVMVKRSGFYTLRDEGQNLEWNEFFYEHPIPSNAVLANQSQDDPLMYFGMVLGDEARFGPVFANGICFVPRDEANFDACVPDALLVWKISEEY
ncbi:Hypothetical predicted protein [Cloeon dipterum]|uniref:Uncharacterized protein n=1 Tax=Cloeon dipterum TaxID=197152 RepID=A0A8S1DXK6_9INSE|nr:Hypothetical predicted protein [Cloeon dipterum]